MSASTLDQQIDAAFQPVADFLVNIIFYSVPVMEGQDVKLILLWLVSAALFFTVYLGLVNIRYFWHAICLIFTSDDGGEGDENKKTDTTPREDGQISRFQALATSLSGTVGLGNIAGVAVAVSVGGPGATLWMMLMGLFGMSTKFVEVALGVKYRHHDDPEKPAVISGGPMYYLNDAFKKYNLPVIGSIVAGLFAICCIGGAVGGGNMFQANQAYLQVMNVTGGEDSFFYQKGWLFGLILAGIVALVILGGIKSIARVASALVPAMGALYIVAGLIVIGIFYQNIPGAIVAIFDSAFSLQAGIGGLLGGILLGVQRAAFSNEAGLGSAAIVHSNAQTDSHISQGMVGMLGPFIDTIVICSVTALVIVITGAYENGEGIQGVDLTSQAFASGISWFPYILALTVLLFAFSTIITWSYYGQKALTYLCGEKHSLIFIYKIFFCLFVVIGASTDLKNIIAFTDAMILSMAIPNILGLYLLAPEIRRDLKDYIEKIRK